MCDLVPGSFRLKVDDKNGNLRVVDPVTDRVTFMSVCR